MTMRKVAGAVAMLSVLVLTGCATTIPGRAVAEPDATVVGAEVALSADGYGVVIGSSQDAAIDLFIEPQCPHCGQFIRQYGDAIGNHVDDGQLSVTIRPVTFLDFGGNDYSARATNAIFLVASPDEHPTPKLVWEFIQGMYEELLTTASPPNDDGLAQIANDVGVSADTVNRIAAAEPALDADEVSDGNIALMDDYGVPAATPTVYDTVHETAVDFDDPQWLDDLVG
jgi:protein-disulfide isomerase